MDIADYKNPGTVWLWLGLAVLLLDLLAVGVARWEFSYGLVYAFGFLAVGIMLSSEKGGVIGGIAAGLAGLLATFTSSGYLNATSIALVNVLLLAIVVLDEMGYIPWGTRTSYAKYATLIAFAAWFAFPASYFYLRLVWAWELPIETILYHGGIMLLAGLDLVTFLGAVKFEYYHTLRVLFAVCAIIGATLLTTVLGWGLALV